MTAIGKFPIYEADQVLSAEHLNQSLGFLEEHDRLSRRLLHGVGIVCGFNFTFKDGTLTIDKGVGISSEGYLLFSDQEMVLTKVRDYIPPYPPKYPSFYSAANQPFNLWEAVPESQAEGENLHKLSTFNTADKVLLLYLEAKDKDLKECVGDDCDNNGTVRDFTLRPLFIAAADLVKIFNRDGNTVEDISSAVFARYTLSEVVPPRFDVTPTNIKTLADINLAYTALCDELLPEIKIALAKIELLYTDALGVTKQLAERYKEIENKFSAAKKEEMGLQYFFDYLCDVAAAYNEFTEVATRWMVSCIPDKDDFPMHLALGEFTQLGNYKEKIFRNYFTHASTSPEAQEQKKHVLFLYKRLLKIASNYDLESQRDIKISPSNFATPLSNKAIPYYFKPNNKADTGWLTGWNFYRTERNTWKRVGHYFNQPETLLQKEIEFNNFYRIEGHLGLNYKTALAGIQKDIQNFRLPIKTIALSTGSVPFDLSLLEECRVADIEENFRDAKNSLYCQMQEVSCFFGAIETPGANQNKKALAESSVKTHKTADSATSLSTPDLSAAKSYSDSIARFALANNARTSNFSKGQFIGSRCKVKNQTLGRAYLDAAAEGTIKNISLLDVYLPYLNMANRSVAVKTLYLGYLFPYIIIDEIEELAAILHNADVANLDYKVLKVFANEFTALVDLYINEINQLELDVEVDLPPLVHDIKHHLLHLRSFCKLTALFGVYKAYRQRVMDSLSKFTFSQFLKTHPGIDHKAGAPRGGTFILVYHTLTKNNIREVQPKLEMARTDVRTSAALYERVVNYNPSVILTATAKEQTIKSISKEDASRWMQENLAKYGEITNRYISPSLLEKLRDLLDLTLGREEEESNLTEGTVIADFYLPYICTTGCGGIEITLKEEKEPLTLSLEKARFCIGDEGKYIFKSSPVGGVVTGDGVEKEGADFVFSPSASNLKAGPNTFTYTFEGRTVQLTITLLEQPIAGFTAEVTSSRSATFVTLTNTSKNAKSFRWDFDNGQTSTDENPQPVAYKRNKEEVVITLMASNGICEDVEVQTIPLVTTQYEIVIKESSKDFCSDEAALPVRLIANGVEESAPYSGVLLGKGVTLTSGAKSRYFFNPGNADLGANTLQYEVGGEIVATLDIQVEKGFIADFITKTELTQSGLIVQFSNISPAGKNEYRWMFDKSNPLGIDVRKDNKEFTHLYTARDLKGKTEIEVELLISDGACSPTVTKTVTIPKKATEKKPKKFVITDVTNRIKKTTTKRILITGGLATIGRTTVSTNPITAANKFIEDVNKALEDKAVTKKLIAGSMNNAIGKEASTVLTNLQGVLSKSRAKLTKESRNQLVSTYGNVGETLINVIGLINNDLSKTESLMKALTLLGSQTKALKPMLSKEVVNSIKDRMAALSLLDKANVSAAASKIVKTL